QRPAPRRKGSKGCLEDVITLLDEIEMRQVERSAACRIAHPVIEVAPVRKMVVDQSGEHAGNQRMAVAVSLQIALNVARRSTDAAGAEKRLCVRGEKAGKTLATYPWNRLAGGVEKCPRNESRSDEDLGRRSRRQRTQEIVVFGADRSARVTIRDL